MSGYPCVKFWGNRGLIYGELPEIQNILHFLGHNSTGSTVILLSHGGRVLSVLQRQTLIIVHLSLVGTAFLGKGHWRGSSIHYIS